MHGARCSCSTGPCSPLRDCDLPRPLLEAFYSCPQLFTVAFSSTTGGGSTAVILLQPAIAKGSMSALRNATILCISRRCIVRTANTEMLLSPIIACYYSCKFCFIIIPMLGNKTGLPYQRFGTVDLGKYCSKDHHAHQCQSGVPETALFHSVLSERSRMRSQLPVLPSERSSFANNCSSSATMCLAITLDAAKMLFA